MIKTRHGRRSFLKSVAISGGGLMLGFNWLTSCQTDPGTDGLVMPETWSELNGFLKVGDNGMVTIMSPNPEGGQNVKTSMPMIVAEELDVNWKKVIVEQAPLDTEKYTRQFIGGSQALRRGWESLRVAGASARHMLRQAAAQAWEVPVEEVTTASGILYHESSGRSADYGAFASAAANLPVPEEVQLKDPKDFTLIGTSRKNVDGRKIVTGKPLFGSDIQREGMLIAMIAHPPAFGMQLKAFDDSAVRHMPGIREVFPIRVLEDEYAWQYFDTYTFPEVVAIVGESTWQVMQAKKALQVEWEPMPERSVTRDMFGREQTQLFPAGLESTADHRAKMAEMAGRPGRVARQDGDPEAAFRRAATVIERTYTAPFLAHNCMEPMTFFANVSEERAELIGPLQKPEYTEQTLSARLGMPLEKIDIQMTRLGGGYGRRSYAHWLVEAALISRHMKAPVKLMYTREDDMTGGIYRPTYSATYRAGLDADGNLIAFHVKAGGIPESPLYANRFPAGAVDHYLAEEWSIDSNITVGSFRAPRSNFIAGVEQAFLDEVAEAAGKDPIAFRLELLQRAQTDPVGDDNDYDPARYAGVLELARDRANWGQEREGIHRGVSAYYCHNSYVAHVLDLKLTDGQPSVENVCCAVDCGIVVNPDAATNLAEGAIVDGIGCALYGAMPFKDGVPEHKNFDTYRMIRMREAPKNIEVHFVQNEIAPTGLGEPPFPPVFGAVANALYKATGTRSYDQPFLGQRRVVG